MNIIRFSQTVDSVRVGDTLTDGYIGHGRVATVRTHRDFPSLRLITFDNGITTTVSKDATVFQVEYQA